MSGDTKTLYDLNEHLFNQLERLNVSELKGDVLRDELARAQAVSMISKDIVSNARLVLEADKHRAEYGAMRPYPTLLDGPKK